MPGFKPSPLSDYKEIASNIATAQPALFKSFTVWAVPEAFDATITISGTLSLRPLGKYKPMLITGFALGCIDHEGYVAYLIGRKVHKCYGCYT